MITVRFLLCFSGEPLMVHTLLAVKRKEEGRKNKADGNVAKYSSLNKSPSIKHVVIILSIINDYEPLTQWLSQCHSSKTYIKTTKGNVS